VAQLQCSYQPWVILARSFLAMCMLQLLYVSLLMCVFVCADAFRLAALPRQRIRLHHVAEGSALTHLGEVSEHGGQSEAELYIVQPNLSKIERTGLYAWPVVHNCRVVSRSGKTTPVHVKPRDVPWSQLKNWTSGDALMNATSGGGEGVDWTVGVRFSFGGSVKGKGRFLKNIWLVPTATCQRKVSLKLEVTKVRSFISKKYKRNGPVAGATFSLKEVHMRKHLGRFKQTFTAHTQIYVYGNGVVRFKWSF